MSSPNMNSEYEEIFADKPKDWPANNREQTLDLISEWVGKFRENPTHRTREIAGSNSDGVQLKCITCLVLLTLAYCYELTILKVACFDKW